MYPKSRFCELTRDEIQEIIDKAVPETAKKAAEFGMRLFNGQVRICSVSLKTCNISSVTVESLSVCDDYNV